MTEIVLFEDAGYAKLLPLVYWRCVANLRCGRKTLLDSAAYGLRKPISGVWARSWLAAVCGARCQTPVNRPASAGTLLVNSRWLVTRRSKFNPAPFIGTRAGEIAYIACDEALAAAVSPETLLDARESNKLIEAWPSGEVEADLFAYPWDLLARNADMLRDHWSGEDRAQDGKVSSSAFLINPDHIHVGERSEIRPTAVIDASHGPVFISNDVLIDVHTYIEGPVYIGPGSAVKPHAAIRAGTTLGPLCKVAGEISASILAGYVNKQHDGFLGHAYVGSWVNFGAGTTNSNLKNTYGTINVQLGDQTIRTDHQFIGAMIGDFTRLGIGQLLPTGAVVGFGVMLANGGFAPKFVPSFDWLTADGRQKSDAGALLQTAQRIMARRKTEMTPDEVNLFRRLPELAAEHGI